MGKTHSVFQEKMRRGPDGCPYVNGALLTKTVGRNIRHDRRYFRYELASSLAFLAAKDWGRDADLGAFLIAAHHGKVRMNLRAPPREPAPKDDERARARFARGIWRATSFPRWSWAAGSGGTAVRSHYRSWSSDGTKRRAKAGQSKPGQGMINVNPG